MEKTGKKYTHICKWVAAQHTRAHTRTHTRIHSTTNTQLFAAFFYTEKNRKCWERAAKRGEQQRVCVCVCVWLYVCVFARFLGLYWWEQRRLLHASMSQARHVARQKFLFLCFAQRILFDFLFIFDFIQVFLAAPLAHRLVDGAGGKCGMQARAAEEQPSSRSRCNGSRIA